MSADPTSIERIRKASFATARRGYKKQDVDRFLASLADWLASGGGRQQSVLVKEALEDVGRRTAKILVTAEESAQEIREKAQQIREEAETYAKQTRERAEQQAQALKESSEAEAERTRSVAARDAEETVSKAKADVRTVVEQGEAQKADLESEIDDLGKRRDSIVARIDELASQLTGTADEHRLSELKAAQASEKEAKGDGSKGSERARSKEPAKAGGATKRSNSGGKHS